MYSNFVCQVVENRRIRDILVNIWRDDNDQKLRELAAAVSLSLDGKGYIYAQKLARIIFCECRKLKISFSEGKALIDSLAGEELVQFQNYTFEYFEPFAKKFKRSKWDRKN